MDNLNAQLELRFELIRSITPKYSTYKYAETEDASAMILDDSRTARALKAASKAAKKWVSVDVDLAAQNGGFARGDAVKKLQDWHNRGAIVLQPSGVVNRFRVLKEFPQDEKAKHSIVTTMYARIKERERDEMARIGQVISLLTTRSCISRGLAEHFSDEQSVPESGCGHCSVCLTKQPLSFSHVQKTDRKGRINEAKFKAILKATAIRDDPYFLARVALGVGSPRVTSEKLGKHAVFGSMEDCEFEVCVAFYPEPLALADNVLTAGIG